MKRVTFVQSCANMMLLLLFGVCISAVAQNTSPGAATTSGAASTGANSGTYYIEDEILAYKSLQLNSQRIVDSVKGTLTNQTGVVVVPSASTILPAFQLWRTNMLVVKTFNQQAERVLNTAFTDSNHQVKIGVCSAKTITTPRTPAVGSPSFTGTVGAASAGLGLLQGIISLFTSNESAAGFQGTVQDQALMLAVAQELRTANSGVQNLAVLTPDLYTSWNIDVAEGGSDKDFFIGRLGMLVTELSNLQDYYFCNQNVVAVGQTLTQSEQTLDADLTALATPNVKPTDVPALKNDANNQEKEIVALRERIGLDTAPGSDEAAWKSALDDGKAVLFGETSGDKAAVLKNILTVASKVIVNENILIAAATKAESESQSVASGISGYLSSLTGGAVTVSTTVSNTPSATPSAAPTAGQTAPSGTTSPAGAGTQTPASATQGGTAQTTSPASSSVPPIVTILQADGLARRMDVEVVDNGGWPSTLSKWNVLWVKSLDSGSTTDLRSSIWGSSPRFAGGAVSGYALFTMKGDLMCSGNTAAYGGDIDPGKFIDPAKLKVEQMISLNSGCAARQSPN